MMLSFFNGPQYTRDISWAMRQVLNWLCVTQYDNPQTLNCLRVNTLTRSGMTHLEPRAI